LDPKKEHAMTDVPKTLTPEQVERRQRIKALTERTNALYAELKTIAAERDPLILDEMSVDGVVARDIAELTGLTVARIYKLKDNAVKRQATED
jgi:DNA-directed RNA polymerase specialized sigma subunit